MSNRSKNLFIDELYSNIPVAIAQIMFITQSNMQSDFLNFTFMFFVPKAINNAKIPETTTLYRAMYNGQIKAVTIKPIIWILKTLNIANIIGNLRFPFLVRITAEITTPDINTIIESGSTLLSQKLPEADSVWYRSGKIQGKYPIIIEISERIIVFISFLLLVKI